MGNIWELRYRELEKNLEYIFIALSKALDTETKANGVIETVIEDGYVVVNGAPVRARIHFTAVAGGRTMTEQYSLRNSYEISGQEESVIVSVTSATNEEELYSREVVLNE